MATPSSVSRAAEWSWVLLAFVAVNLLYATTQPVHPREGLGEGGQAYHAMAKAMPRELSPSAVAPYAHRLGLPLAAAALAKSKDWVIAAGFDRLNLVFNALSVVLLTVLLRRHVDGVFARIAVIIAFLVEPHSPVRLSYLHPISTDAVVLAVLLAGMVAIEWFQAAPSPRRASFVAVLVAGGVAFHEAALLIGVCLLVGPLIQQPWSGRGFEKLRQLDRTGAWLPLLSGLAMLAVMHAWVSPTPSPYSVVSVVTQSFQQGSVVRYGLSWLLVFGPLLVLPSYFWNSSARFLRDQPVFLIYLVACCGWAWVGGSQAERFVAVSSPVVYILIARALAGVGIATASPAMTVLLVLQAVSSRVFSPIGPIEPPVVVGDVWERLGSANVAWAWSYQNLWSRSCAAEMLPVYLLWYALTGGAVVALLWYRGDGFPRMGSARRTMARLVSLSRWRPGGHARIALLVSVGTIVAMAPVVWLVASRFYWHHYADPGAGYLFYNLARIWLVVVLLLAFLSTGSRIVEYRTVPLTAPRRWRERFIESAFTGAAAWSVLVVVLAALHVYYAWVLLPIVAAAVAAAVFDLVASPTDSSGLEHSPALRWGLVGLLLRLIAAVTATAILVTIALWGHYGGDNDVPGNYLPYYGEVLRNHSIAPGGYWVHYFASKGHGLAFLANALSDVNGAALATFLVLMLGAAMLWRLASPSTAAASAIGMIGVCLYFQYYAGQGAYAKSHVIRNTFILYLIVARVRSMCSPVAGSAIAMMPGLVVMSAVIVLSPLAAVLLLPIVLGGGALLALSGKQDEARRSIGESAWVLLVTAGVGAYNFLQVGLPELHNMPSFVARFVNFERFSQWMDPDLAYVDYRLGFLKVALPGNSASNAAMSMAPVQSLTDALPGIFSAPITTFLAGTIAIAMITAVLSRWRPWNGSVPVGPLCAATYLVFILAVVTALRVWGGGGPGSSMGRFTDFANPVGITLGMVMLGMASTLKMGRVTRRLRAVTVAAVAVAAFASGAESVWALPWRASTRFLVGQSSYAQMNEGGWDTATAYRVARSLPAGVRVEMVNFLPGFTAIPDTPFQRPDGCVYLKDYTRVIYGAADQAAAVFRGVDIHYFLFDVSPDAPVTWSGLAPLFTPESIGSRMQLVSHERSATRDLYLLTWRQAEAPADEAFDRFLSRWRAKLEWEKANGYFHGSYDEGARLIGLRN